MYSKSMEKFRRQAWISWASVGLLAVLCAALAFLQHRWLGEISQAEGDRLHASLQAGLLRLSRDFNAEITSACAALIPSAADIEKLGREKAYAARYFQFRESHDALFERIALAVPDGDSLTFSTLDLGNAQFSPAAWPASWEGMRDRLTAHLNGGGMGRGFGGGGPGGGGPGGGGPGGGGFGGGIVAGTPSPSTLFEVPRFGPPREGDEGPPRGMREQEWLLVELSRDYLRGTLFPTLLQRHLGDDGKLDYDAEVVSRTEPPEVVYDSIAETHSRIGQSADASVALFEINYGRLQGGGFGRSGRPMPPGMADGGMGRWRLLVRHRAGSLEVLVGRERWRNLAISAAILLLILATVAMLVRFSRQAQQLANLQINFVAGVSHELRTPLTVIRTAAFNLRGKIATRPEQVEKYGKLIQDESEKLAATVEQVLRFASTKAGHVIRDRAPLAIESLIEDGLRSSRAAVAGGGLVIERHVEPGLPLILADELAMKHVLQNLVDNAVKYGTEGDNWIGIFAAATADENGPAIEIRVADHGPGIPLDEQEHIFDPFFRGRQAVRDQVHGTGLGLNLVKEIVEAHGGTIRVQSQPMKGTEFIVRIPAAPQELQDEFAHTLG